MMCSVSASTISAIDFVGIIVFSATIAEIHLFAIAVYSSTMSAIHLQKENDEKCRQQEKNGEEQSDTRA
jgi:hypothetical protein